jgi:hypothetical protein
MHSIIIDNKVLDFKFKKQAHFTDASRAYAFYIGDILVGQVFNFSSGWTAVSKQPHPLCPVVGFKTRLDAAEMLLKLNGYRDN